MEPADSAETLEGSPEAAQGKPRLTSQLSAASLEEEDNKDSVRASATAAVDVG
jgi:hypothetical protein